VVRNRGPISPNVVTITPENMNEYMETTESIRVHAAV
jgi:hypothetical protein